MSTDFRIAAFASIVAGLLANPAALAAPPAPGGTDEGRAPPPPAFGKEHGAEFLAGRLDTLHTALKLKPEQESAWKKWSDSVRRPPEDWKEKHADATPLAKLTVPERLEKMVAFAKERLARLEERLIETKAFYEVLSPAQRQTFDKDFNFWPHAGRSGKSPGRHGHSLIGPRIGSP